MHRAGPVEASRRGRARQPGHDAGSGNLANIVVVGVGDIHRTRAVDRHPARTVEPCGAARPLGLSGRACQARQRRHDGTSRDFPDRVIVGIRHIQDTRAVYGNPPRLIESRVAASRIGSPRRTRQARQRGDDAAGVIFRIV